MNEETIARILGSYITELSLRDLPKPVIERAKTRLLDSLGCCIAGRELPWSRVAIETVKNNTGECTIIAHQEKAPAMDAALANGVLAHSILQEDTLGGAHPSTIIAPAVLAAAEREDASGSTTVLSIVLGYDIMYRISLGEPRTPLHKGFRRSLFGTFGAAAAAGKLMRLSTAQIAHALGYSAALASGLSETFWSGTMDFAFQAGLTARNGIMAATLAKAGATAAERTLEGPDGFFQAYFPGAVSPDFATRDLGKSFYIMEAVEKAYPACAACQSPIETALTLSKHGISPKDIDRVVETTSLRFIAIPGSDALPPYHGVLQAQISHQFCIAAALLGKPVTDPSFYAHHYDDQEIADLARKVKITSEADREYPKIDIFLRDGKSCTLDPNTSHPAAGFVPTVQSTRTKFLTLATEFMGERGAEEIVDIVMNLEELNSLRDLTRRLGANSAEHQAWT